MQNSLSVTAFPDVNLEDKVVSDQGGIVRNIEEPIKDRTLKVYYRKKVRKTN